MTRTKRAAELARLAWLADSGRLVVTSHNPDANAILVMIGPSVFRAPIDPEATSPYASRHRVACMLFASAAMTEAVRLGHVE